MKFGVHIMYHCDGSTDVQKVIIKDVLLLPT